MASADPLVRQSTSSLWLTDLLPEHLHLLPQALGTGWSAAEHVLKQASSSPISLTTLQRCINSLLIRYAQRPSSKLTVEEVASIKDFFDSPLAPEPSDTAGYVHSYHALVDDPAFPVPYSRKLRPWALKLPFPLANWWALHIEHCSSCMALHHKCNGSFERVAASNESNLCTFADIMNFLSGGWRLPLSSKPKPGAIDNYASLLWCPSSMGKEVKRMLSWSWETLKPGNPILTHPAMGVIKEGDLNRTLRVLSALGHPSPYTDKPHVEALNDHITSVRSTLPPELSGITYAHTGEVLPRYFCPSQLCP